LKRKHRGFGDTFFIEEVFVKINGKQHYLWRAVDQDGEVVDVYLQAQRRLGMHAAVSNLFNWGRHLVSAGHYRFLRVSAFFGMEQGSGLSP
jgi:transposase-like protein